MIYTDLYRIIELDLLAWLQSDPKVGLLPGLALEPGHPYSVFADAVTKSLGIGADGKMGMGYLVQPIEQFVDDEAEVTFGALRLPIRIDLTENVVLNRDKNRGRQIQLRALAAYVQKMAKVYWAQNLTTDLIPDNPAIQIFTKHDDDNIRVARLFFHTYESDTIAFQAISSPMYSVTDANNNPVAAFPVTGAYPYTVTVTCDAGAAIYYSVDGTSPWPGRAANAAANFAGIQTSAQLYQAPIQIPGPCFLRLRGIDPAGAKIGSKISSILFT